MPGHKSTYLKCLATALKKKACKKGFIMFGINRKVYGGEVLLKVAGTAEEAEIFMLGDMVLCLVREDKEYAKQVRALYEGTPRENLTVEQSLTILQAAISMIPSNYKNQFYYTRL